MLHSALAGIMLAILIPATCSTIAPDRSQAYGVALSMVRGDRTVRRTNDAGWVTVTLTNVSGRDLSVVYLPQSARLRFEIEDASGRPIESRMYPLVLSSIRTSAYFPAGRTAVIAARLVDWNTITKPGTYRVRAIYRVAMMDVHRDVELISNQVVVVITVLPD